MNLLDGLRPENEPACLRDPRRLFAQAALCSRLAKLAEGQTRRQLYRLKNECLMIIKKRFPQSIELRGDQDRHRGLLSIALRRTKRHRLHTHESWMTAA